MPIGLATELNLETLYAQAHCPASDDHLLSRSAQCHLFSVFHIALKEACQLTDVHYFLRQGWSEEENKRRKPESQEQGEGIKKAILETTDAVICWKAVITLKKLFSVSGAFTGK